METLLSLYRAAGHEVPAIPTRRQTATVPQRRGNAYDAAGTGRRGRAWHASAESVNSLLFANAEILRNRSRDAIRKNPWASNALDSYTANGIGSGIKPISLSTDATLRKKIHDEWRRWTDQSDFYGMTDFYGQQALAFRSMLESGEVLIRFRTVTDRKLRVPFQIQIIESDHLPLTLFYKPKTVAAGNDIRSGIELDADGRRIAYHIHKEHPGDTEFFNRNTELQRVPAEEMVLMFRQLRPSQLRGQPWLTNVLVTLYELDQYTDAALVRKKIATLLAGFITKTDPASQVVDESTRSVDDPSVAEAVMEPGTLLNLLPGEDVKWSDPPSEDDFEAFVGSHLRAIAAGCGLAQYMVDGNLSNFNYSSARAGLLEFRRKCEQLQYSVPCFQMCRPIIQAWMQHAIMAGVFPVRDFNARPLEYLDFRWITPGWPWVDPLKDISAAAMEVKEGFTSRAAVVAAKGEDIETIDAENAADEKRWPSGPVYGDHTDIAKLATANRNERLLLEPEDNDDQRKEIVQ